MYNNKTQTINYLDLICYQKQKESNILFNKTEINKNFD